MLVGLALTVAAYVFSKFLIVINSLMTVLNGVSGFVVDGTVGASYIFGNLGLFDAIFPVTETAIIVTLALSIKATIFGIKVIFAINDMVKYVWRSIVSFRF